MKRRNVLAGAGRFAAAGAMPSLFPGIVSAAPVPWGGIDTGMERFKILQIVCYGGLSMWQINGVRAARFHLQP